jgi:hypothetical protein
MKKILPMILSMVLLCGCSVQSDDNKKLNDLEFTVISQDEIPKELAAQIEEEKADEVKLTYSDNENLYIARGYGEQETGGYSISVDEVYETENAVFFKTSLIGPAAGEKTDNNASYPCVVIKMKLIDKNVVFE